MGSNISPYSTVNDVRVRCPMRNNMKCTCPTREFCVGDPTPPIFHLFALGIMQILAFTLGVNFSVFRYQHDDIANANFCVGGLTQPEAPTPVVLRHSGM